jgi:uncharacterized membrane protein YoaK (UPF0700 family)
LGRVQILMERTPAKPVGSASSTASPKSLADSDKTIAERMSGQVPVKASVGILVAMTVATGIVDAVSFLALGRVFTANMTGNVVLLGFALAGVPGLSLSRSALALLAFLLGAVLGGRLAFEEAGWHRWAERAFMLEALLLGVAAVTATGNSSSAVSNPLQLHAVIVTTAVAMGLRNAIVRKLAVPDMTTTVLTLTITGLAADSSLAGGGNPRWQRRGAGILAMITGAFAGARMLTYSISLPLAVACGIAAMCAAAHRHLFSEGRES